MNKAAGIVLACFLSVVSVFMGLWFMGVISFADNEVPPNDVKETGEENGFEIVFKGIKFNLNTKCIAYIHESGCLNIRLKDEYLIQIDVEDDTCDDFWDNREEKIENLIASGYRIEREPEHMEPEEREYIHYILSMEGERGAEYSQSYFEIYLTPADNDRRFFVCIRYDGIDVDNLDEEARTLLYNEAFGEVEQIIDNAAPTDEKDDAVGTGWLPDESISSENEYLSHDSLQYADGTLEVAYNLPEECYLVSDNITGKTYLSEKEKIYINLTTSNYTWQTAKEKADKHSLAGFSRIITEGQTEVNGRTFYYYTYSVMRCSKRKKRYDYNFVAYCDMKNGDIYSIHGYSYENETAMDCNFYLDVMNLSE